MTTPSAESWCHAPQGPKHRCRHFPIYAEAVSQPHAEALLTSILVRAQAEGALGARPIVEVISHTRSFVAALPDGVLSVMDLGSGAGIPGLVVALDRPLLQVTLVDRRANGWMHCGER